MAWVDAFKGRIVGLDTAPLIYFIEENPKYVDMVDLFFEALDRRELSVVTSTITLLEVLVNPIKQNNASVAAKYRDILLKARNLSLIPFTQPIAEEAARIRAIYNLHVADAIQVATAILAGASAFLTNDLKLASVPDIKVLVLDKLKTDS